LLVVLAEGGATGRVGWRGTVTVVGSCATCKHWEQDSTPDEPLWGGRCRRIKHANAHIDFTRIPRPWEIEMEIVDPLSAELQKLADEERAVVKDGSGYFAAFRCKADFGCVLHEEKDGAT